MGIFSIFGTSLRALNAYSGALSVVANNVANSSNENYSRQRVEFNSLAPDNFGGIETGRGVELGAVTQVVDRFVEKRYTDSIQAYGTEEAKSEYLSSVDAVFVELDGNGLNASIGNFFDSFNALATEPESTPFRNNVLDAAGNMISIFQQYADQLDDLRQTIDLEMKGVIPTLNNKLTELKELNQTILETETDALTYKDQRRAVINEIAEYIDVNVVETNDEIQLYTKAGNPLVNGITTATFSTLPNASNDNLLDIRITVGDTTSTITSTIQEGRLKGLVTARDTHINDYLNQLDELAYEIATEVNTLHAAGYDLGGTGSQNFFGVLASSSDAATNISLNASVDGLPENIAASDAAAEVPGGNQQALAIAALADSSSITFTSGNNSFSGFFSDLLADVGSDVSLAISSEEFRASVLEETQLERIETSGVSVDEEEIKLVKFQAAYEASGRLISIADSILETLIDILI